MNDPRPKEAQQELFEEFSARPSKPERFPSLSRSNKPLLISTNSEQLLLIGILLILALCLIFFLGVLRGKALSHSVLIAPPTVRSEVMTPRARQSVPVSIAPRAINATVLPRTSVASTTVRPAPTNVVTPYIQKPYTIQLVTHRKKEFAETEMNALRAQGLYSFIIPNGAYFEVCVGQYASREDAKKDLGRFLGKYKDCFLRSR